MTGGVCRYYNAWYVDLCTEAEREAILQRNIAAHRRRPVIHYVVIRK